MREQPLSGRVVVDLYLRACSPLQPSPHTSIPDYFYACDLRLSPRELFSSIDFILYEGFPPLFAFLERAGYDSD